MQEGSLFSTPSPAFIVCRFFDDGYSDQCEVVPLCSFDLHFSNNYWCWASFHVFVGNLWRNVYLDLPPIFLIGLFVFLILNYMSCLYILEINPLSDASFANIFSHSVGCLFVLFTMSFAVQSSTSFHISPLAHLPLKTVSSKCWSCLFFLHN